MTKSEKKARAKARNAERAVLNALSVQKEKELYERNRTKAVTNWLRAVVRDSAPGMTLVTDEGHEFKISNLVWDDGYKVDVEYPDGSTENFSGIIPYGMNVYCCCHENTSGWYD